MVISKTGTLILTTPDFPARVINISGSSLDMNFALSSEILSPMPDLVPWKLSPASQYKYYAIKKQLTIAIKY